MLGAAPPSARTGDLANTAGGPPQNSTTIVLAAGCVTAGDGGGGVFYWDSSATADDGGTVIVPGGATSAGGWRRAYSGALDVRWFGTTADGATDDQPAIQKALDAAATTGNSLHEVLIPSGSYVLRNTLVLPSTVWLRGVGYGAIGASSVALNFHCSPSTSLPWGDGILVNGANRISNLTINNYNASNTTGYGIHCGGKIVVESCNFDGWQNQLVFDGAEISECRDCTFSSYLGVPVGANNVHIWFAPPHGRLNTVSGATNTTRITHCNFFANGGVFIWHADGLAYDCDFINLELINPHGESTPPAVACFKISNAQQIHYSHITTGDGGDVPIFLVGGGTNTVAANGLTIDNSWIVLPATQPFLWVLYPNVAWGAYIKNNVFIGSGRPSGIIKLDYVMNHWELSHNFYWGNVNLFDGIGQLTANGKLCEPGLGAGAFGIGTSSPASALAVNEGLAGTSNKAIRVFDPSNTTDDGNFWVLHRGGKAIQWKRGSSGQNADIPNGETVYQEYFITHAGSSVAHPFASATDFPLMSGLYASDFSFIIYEMEAMGHGDASGRYYHRKQRIAVRQYGGNHDKLLGVPPDLWTYPDEFKNSIGSGWSNPAANMDVSGSKIELSVNANLYDSIYWYVKVRVISRSNQGDVLP